MKYICIHGHFYQPPRENPWLERIEPQDSAYPYHDWNERINSECFAPNAECRILNNRDEIVKIVNNYSRMSFNFGPTLLSWMEQHAPEVYRAILSADKQSIQHYSGHGSAIAQAYSHAILPLASKQQKLIQIKWGIADFKHRFGRDPEGMWLPETAVDLETLEILAAEGIRFTILAPRQAKRVRRLGESGWIGTLDSDIDPKRPYLQKLPSGADINLFFYDGPTARAVAFEGLLRDGESFSNRLLSQFSVDDLAPQLVHIATDGETYGHHHRFGEMALAYALERISNNGLAKVTNYGQFLSMNPPTWEVDILENTSWSCAHGVERWRSDCGCNSGAQPGWDQKWRQPLRESLDHLEAALNPAFEKEARELFSSPWTAFQDYIQVILDRSDSSVRRFLSQHVHRRLSPTETVRALKLMELERFLTLSFTSCGWFFDDVGGIETRQILQYSGRALQLAQELFESDYQRDFVGQLSKARSNDPARGTAAQIYDKWVNEAKVDLLKVGAHHALCSLFGEVGDESPVYVYKVQSEDYDSHQAGRARMAVGKSTISSNITGESVVITFGVLSMGNHTLVGGVREFQSEADYQRFKNDVKSTLDRVDFPEMIRVFDRHFGKAVYSLNSLFVEERRRILKIILDSTLSEVEAALGGIYHRHNPLMRYLETQEVPLPEVFQMTSQFVLNTQLRRELKAEELDPASVLQYLEEAKNHKVELDTAALNYYFQTAIETLAVKAFTEEQGPVLEKLAATMDLMDSGVLKANLWKVQNLYYQTLQSLKHQEKEGASQAWIELFLNLGKRLSVNVSE